MPTDADEDFKELFENEYARLGKALYLVTGDVSEAEELCQEAFVRIYERWDRVMRLEDPSGYLYRTALNLHRSRLRRLMAAARHRPEPSPTDELADVERQQDIMTMLSVLPRNQRAALVLVEWLGFSSETAAQIMKIKASTVRVHLSRARASLRIKQEASND